MPDPDAVPGDVDALRAALAAEQQMRLEAELRAAGVEAIVAHLKLMIAQAAASPVRCIVRTRTQAARPDGAGARRTGSRAR